MKQGIIMEVNDRFLTLLTPDGQFLKARNQNNQYQIGQEISFIPVEKESLFSGFSKVLNKRTASFLVATSLLLFFTFLPFNTDNEVYAYMSIDGESSIELAVNKDLKVVEAIAYNDSGKEIISSINWENEHVDKVSSEIISSIGDTGTEGIVVGTAYAESKQAKKDEKLHQVVASLKEETEVEIKDVQATAIDRKEAKEKGLTVGNYKAQQAKANSKDKKGNIEKEKPVNEQKTKEDTQSLIDTPVTEPIVTPPAPNNNGNGNDNQNTNQNGNQNVNSSSSGDVQNPGQGKGNEKNSTNPGQQKKMANETSKPHPNTEKKQENANKEQKPRK